MGDQDNSAVEVDQGVVVRRVIQVVRKYMVSSWWYLQSALWGGKTEFLLEMLVELAHRVKLDRAANIYSMTVQDERYALLVRHVGCWCKT